MKKRTTFTIGDTWDETEAGTYPGVAALPLLRPGWEAVSPGLGDILNYATIGDLTSRMEEDEGITVPYIEAQFHKRVTLQDVTEVVISHEEPETASLIEMLKGAQIPYREVQ